MQRPVQGHHDIGPGPDVRRRPKGPGLVQRRQRRPFGAAGDGSVGRRRPLHARRRRLVRHQVVRLGRPARRLLKRRRLPRMDQGGHQRRLESRRR